MLSAGRPVFGSVIATRLRHVSAAHVRTVALSRERTAYALLREVVDAEADGASAKAATEAAPPTSSARRLVVVFGAVRVVRLGVCRVFGVWSVMRLCSVSVT